MGLSGKSTDWLVLCHCYTPVIDAATSCDVGNIARVCPFMRIGLRTIGQSGCVGPVVQAGGEAWG